MNVQNELGVIVAFAQACQDNGWEINHIQSEFPDAIVQDANGDTYRAEFEFCASNFKAHQHDLCQCDVIICWENDWDDCPLTVWSMKNWDDPTVTIRDRKDLIIASLMIENERLKRQLSKAERANKSEKGRRATIDEWRDIAKDCDDIENLDAKKVNDLLKENGFAEIPSSSARYWAKDAKEAQ